MARDQWKIKFNQDKVYTYQTFKHKNETIKILIGA